MKATVLAAIAAALVLAGCGGGLRTTAGHASPSAVPQLRSISELRATFNAHPGVPRLLVLISPT